MYMSEKWRKGMPSELKLCQGFLMYEKSMDKQFINKVGNQTLDEVRLQRFCF